MELKEKLEKLGYNPKVFDNEDGTCEISENCFQKVLHRTRDEKHELWLDIIIEKEQIFHAGIFDCRVVVLQSDIDDLQRAFNILKSDLRELKEHISFYCEMKNEI